MTSQIKHTPAPWWTNGSEVGTVPMMAIKICNRVGGADYEQVKANAALIAAAPDLLAAGRELQALYMDLLDGMNPDNNHPVMKMQAAIDKASKF